MKQFRRSFSALLACLLVLICLSMPGVRTALPVSGETQSVQELPDGLRRALLAASAKPFEASAEGYFTDVGGLEFTSIEQKVMAADGEVGDSLGCSVVISDDTALVGATGDDVGTNADQGSVYVFVRSGATWSLQQKLTAADGAAGDEFGVSVALDGDTALVGAEWDDVGANTNQGSAYVFTRDGTTWTQQAKLTAADGATDDQFGTSVALSGDTALVGAVWDDVGGNGDQGSAYVFTRSGTTWTQQAQLTAADGAAQDALGRSVALSADGNTALVGVGLTDVTPGAGEAYVFTRSGTSWTQQANLTAADSEEGDAFGWSVALSGDGDTALMGAWADDAGTNTDQGSVYVFTRSGTTWAQQAKLIASDGGTGETYDYFGGSVALSGNTALIGMYWDAYNARYKQGSAYVFTRSGTTWSEQGKLTGSDNKWGNYFGLSVALSGDTALVGAPDWGAIGIDAGPGSVYFYDITISYQDYLPLILRSAP